MVHVDTPGEEPTHPPRRKRRPSPGSVLRLASPPTVKAALVVVGALGLAVLALAMVGPKRVRRKTLQPIGDALETHFEKAWDEVRPIRDQIAALFEQAGPESRKEMARKLQSWIGHFRAK